MRIEIGPDGKIIGTRRVSPNGQVSGLTEFAGREVLVILPGGAQPESVPPWGSPEAVARIVEDQMRQAYQRYELLQKLYATPWEATRSFVRSAFAGSWPDLAAEVDRWVKEQLRSTTGDRTSPSNPSSPGEGGTSSADRTQRGSKRSGKTDEST